MSVNTLSLLMLTIGIISPLTAYESGYVGELPNDNQVPRLVTMNFYQDTQTEMAFRWNTTYPTDSDLQVVLADDGDFESANVLSFQGQCQKSSVANDGFLHSVIATGLSPKKTYLYRVGDKELNAWSEIGSFKTGNEEGRTRFVHLSDPQVFEESHGEAYQETLTLVDEFNPDFLCLTGDIVNNSWIGYTPKLEQWEWAITNQDSLLNYPVMAVAGNHEAASYDFTSRFHYPYADNQDLSTGGYYSFDYQGIHFSCLNTNDTDASLDNTRGLSNQQMEWLQKDLQDAQDAKWKIVLMHKGLFDAGGHCSNVEGTDNDISIMRQQLAPLFNEYKVDVVLQGHDHLYSRSYPLYVTNGQDGLVVQTIDEKVEMITKNDISYQVYDCPSGPIYLNTGTASGSKYYNVVTYDKDLIPLEKAYGSDHKMFTCYEIAENELFANVYEVVNGEAILYDSFGIKKDQTIELTNKKDNKYLLITVIACLLIGIGAVLGIVIYKKKGKKNG